ncbi:hypothetical protein PRNP1_002735 [Phytophthora ramorum]
MKLPSVLTCAAVVASTANAGNSNYLRSTGSNSAAGGKQFDFSDVDQTSPTLIGSGSEACPEKCPLDLKPVFDEDGVEYLNECMLRLAECRDNSFLAASDLADVRYMFGSLEGTVYLASPSGSGNQQAIEFDIGLDKIFGGNDDSASDESDSNSGSDDTTQGQTAPPATAEPPNSKKMDPVPVKMYNNGF